MSKLLPSQVIEVVKTFNDLTIGLVGIDCTLYIPTNLTAIESLDMYETTTDITYKTWYNQQVWIEWSGKNINRLRKLGVFLEGESAILARFRNTPEVTLRSYVKIPVQYIPGTYNVDQFEVVDVVINNTYDSELFRWYKLAPKRDKVQSKV
jgi:hypothetical protein